jgi:AraC family transcriptional regulator
MTARADDDSAGSAAAVLSGHCRVHHRWQNLHVEYAWLPPFRGHAPTQPNRLEVIFSAHANAVLEQQGQVHDIEVPAGAMYVVGAEPTTLLQVAEHSDTLEMYPDLALLRGWAQRAGIRHFALEPTLHGQGKVRYRRDPVVLAVAHVLRRACMDRLTLSDIEADTLTHLLAQRLLLQQHGVDIGHSARAGSRLAPCTLARLGEFIEARLQESVTLEQLARVAQLSPFHFARCFKASTGLAPHQYVLARRIELAKRKLMTTSLPVHEVAWAAGFENISHFRRQFARQIGVLPGALRAATTRVSMR